MTRAHALLRSSKVYLLAAAALSGLAWSACTTTSATCADDPSCTPSPDGGGASEDGSPSDTPNDGGDASSDGRVPVAPSDCDTSLEPKDAPKCVVDPVGIFVDGTSGLDTNAGTKASPVRSITAALGRLAGRSRVYVCGEGPFHEHVKLTSAVSLYGGFLCGDWSYKGTKARVAPPSAGYALEIANVAGALSIADVAFEASAGTAEKLSSVAVFVSKSNVGFVRIAATAQDAAKGLSSVATANYDPAIGPFSPEIGGKNATGSTGGARHDCVGICANGVHSTGGKGGNGGTPPTGGEKGMPDLGGGVAGLAAPGGSCSNGGFAGTGVGGTSAPHAVAATVLGTLTETGWTPSEGPAGAVGSPGQGGGGGGGTDVNLGGGGGGGACGGCGGGGATAAQGGGASVALLVFESAVSILDGSLTSATAGRGGEGARGQDGQSGGSTRVQSTGGCQGGAGGAGGSGGASAGGAGGVSAAILYKGAKPTTKGTTTLTPGKRGFGGYGGVANGGLDGVAAEYFEAP